MPVAVAVDTDGVAHLTLDRPAKRNALDIAMVKSLHAAVNQVRDQADVRVVVVRGAGGTFCAGADIADWVDPSPAEARARSQLGIDAFDALARLPQPTLAIIEGSALGGGLELALACDIRISNSEALLGLPELTLGNLPAWGGTARLVDIAGIGVARHLLFTGELITGSRAADLGLVSAAHTAVDLESAVAALVARLLNAEPTATALAKTVLAEAETTLAGEPFTAAYTATLATSRQLKQDFLQRKAARRATSAPPTT